MSGWAAALAVSVFLGVWTALPAGSLGRLGAAGAVGAGAERPVRPGLALIGLAAVLSGCWLAAGGSLAVVPLGLGVVVAAVVIRRVTQNWRGRRERRDRQLAVIELCDSLSAEMRAGLPAHDALGRACAHRVEWSGIVATSRLGGDVATALRRAAGQPGAEGLRAVAAGWQVAIRSGAGLASVLERIAAGLRDDDEARSEVLASLGPPRATAKMLAVLPAFGLALGSSMGARPIAFLLNTGVGLVCLFLGLLLAGLGVVWVERLASSAEI